MVDGTSYPKTHKEYFEDTYRFKSEGLVIDTFPAEEGVIKSDEPHFVMILNKTVFHPQGGGQPNDEGFITLKEQADAGKFIIKALTIKEDVIWHIGQFDKEGAHLLFKKDEPVECHVDEEKRRLFARVHSAGHLLDICMTRAGRHDLKPSKGYHFAAGAYVEYVGECKEADRKPLIESLNQIAKDIITGTPKEMEVFKKVCSYDEAGKQLEKAGGMPPYIPEGSDVRVLKLTEDDAGCPCGGTHVGHVSDIEEITITKIQKKGKSIRVAYNIKGSA